MKSRFALAALLLLCSCGNDIRLFDLSTLFPTQQAFVLKGTADIVDNGGPCNVWHGDNGVTYHLFQDPLVRNETFDRVIEPGTSSRLQLGIRTDLEVDCQVGPMAVVQAILEIIE